MLFRNSQEKKCTAFIQDRQDPNVSLCHQKDTAVLTLSGCHTLCFTSSRTPGSAKFSLPLHLPASQPLPLAKNPFTFSVTALISSLQFPFHFLSFRLQVSLTTNHLSLSLCLQTLPPCLPPCRIRLCWGVLVRC